MAKFLTFMPQARWAGASDTHLHAYDTGPFRRLQIAKRVATSGLNARAAAANLIH
jgi:hypothetical protein